MRTVSAQMEETDLPTILRQMLTDINDPKCHYWLYSNYFEIQPPTERIVARWYMTPLFLDYDAIWNAELVEDGMLYDVILKNKLPAERERIKIEYDQIYSIKRIHSNEPPKSEAEYQIYYKSEKLKMPPVHS